MTAATRATNSCWRLVEPPELYIELKGLYFSSPTIGKLQEDELIHIREGL